MNTPNTLLIVDDDIAVCGMLERTIGRNFKSTYVANTPKRAESILRQYHISHLLVDNVLGEHMERGAVLIPKWRSAFPHIRWAALFSGLDMTDIPLGDGIDRILTKWGDLTTILEAMSITL